MMRCGWTTFHRTRARFAKRSVAKLLDTAPSRKARHRMTQRYAVRPFTSIGPPPPSGLGGTDTGIGPSPLSTVMADGLIGLRNDTSTYYRRFSSWEIKPQQQASSS